MAGAKEISKTGWGHLYPFESHYLDRGGLKYHYLDEGSGAPVVMVHGNPTWSFFYRDMVAALRDRYRVVVPDHMGCGLSDKPDPLQYGFRYRNRVDDLEALLDHLGLEEDVTLVVHDWGGAIGLACAVRRPERIARLVILNTAAFLPPKEKKLPWQLWLVRNVPTVAVPLVLGFNGFARGAARVCARTRLPRDVAAGFLAPYNSWHNRLATLKFVQDIPWRPGDPSYDTLQQTTAGLKHLADKTHAHRLG